MATAYAIGIKLSLVNGVSRALGLIGRDFTRTQAQARALQTTLNSIKFQAFVGAGMFGAGFLGLKLLSKTLPDAREYAHQLNIMNMAGLSHIEIAQAVGSAWKNTSTVITTTATENLKSLLDLRNVLGSMKDAQWALPIVSKVGAVMASSQEGRISGNAQDIAFSMAKALDILGKASDPKTFARNAGEMSKVISAFQGRVSPKMFQSVFAYARQAKFGLSEDFIYKYLGTLMLEYASSGRSQGGGSRGVGPTLAAFVRWRDQGYHIDKKAAAELARLGLINPRASLHTTTSGTTVGAMKGAGNGNFFEWVQNTLMPAINQRFGGHATQSQIHSEILQITRGNQLAGQIISEFALKKTNFLRDAGIISGAMSYNKAYDQARKNDPEFQMRALTAQWNNVLTKLGLVILPSVINGTMGLTDWLSKLIPWMDRNQGLVKDLVWGFAALSGAMLFGGSVLLLTAAFRGLTFILGVGGLLMPGVNGLTAALGARGLMGTLVPLGPAAVLATVAIAGLYAYLVGIKGTTDKSGQWHPAWMKGSFLDTDVNTVFKHALGMKAGDPWVSFAAPAHPKNEFEQQEVAAKRRNDHLIEETWKAIQWLGGVLSKQVINIDGKTVAQVVSKHQARSAGGPVGHAPASFNPKLNPAQP